jgi:hypothetical protein
MKKILVSFLLSASALVASGNLTPASSATCDTAACLLFDNDNINGNGDAINLLGYTTLDKSNWSAAEEAAHPTTANALSITFTNAPGQDKGIGTWSIVGALVAGYENFALGIKTGNNVPDWAAFTLGANFLSVTWIIWAGDKVKDQSLMNLYGKPCAVTGCVRDGTPQVPLPPALPLLLAALGGLGWIARRQKRSNVTAA